MIYTRDGFIKKLMREIDGLFTREESVALKKQLFAMLDLIESRKRDQKIAKFNVKMMALERQRDEEIIKRLVGGEEVKQAFLLPEGEEETES